MLKEVKKGLKSEQSNAVLYAGLIGLIVSDIIPTPADIFSFYVDKKLRDRWKKGDISPEEYWRKKTMTYYLTKPIYWSLVSAIIISIKGDATKKLKVAGALVASGAVAAIIYKNIKSDKKELAEEAKQKQELLKKHPEYAEFLSKNDSLPQFKNVQLEKLEKELEELKEQNRKYEQQIQSQKT